MTERAEKLKKSFDWTQQTIQLLNKLLSALSKTNEAWKRFDSRNGDISYFEDIDSSKDFANSRAWLLLRAIKETFGNLEDLEQKLRLSKGSCNNLAQAVRFEPPKKMAGLILAVTTQIDYRRERDRAASWAGY